MAYWDNIAAEEDIEEAVEKVEKILGKSGRMLPTDKNVSYNTSITFVKYGLVWYGDLYLKKSEIESEPDYDKINAVRNLFPTETMIIRNEQGMNYRS